MPASFRKGAALRSGQADFIRSTNVFFLCAPRRISTTETQRHRGITEKKKMEKRRKSSQSQHEANGPVELFLLSSLCFLCASVSLWFNLRIWLRPQAALGVSVADFPSI